MSAASDAVPFFMPCPFCGGSGKVKPMPKREHDTLAFLQVECQSCGATGPVSAGLDADKARGKWNQQIKADAAHSASYILEDADPEKLAAVCGLPYGVITAALRNILPQKASG